MKTAKPAETEVELKRLLPKEVWKDVNDWLVWFGRTTCKPARPDCPKCVVRGRCPSAKT